MSTKIYNGYRLPNLTVKEFSDLILRFRQDADRIKLEAAAKFFMNTFVEIIDEMPFENKATIIKRHINSEDTRKTLTDSSRPIVKVIAAQGKERYAEANRTMTRDHVVDFDCELCVLPIKNHLLIYLVTEQESMSELFQSYEEVEYYGYWNNTDRDPSCSEEEWKQREKDWKEALPGIGIPSEHGMTIEVLNGFPDLSDIPKDLIMEQQPSFNNRVQGVSERLLLDKLFKKMKEKDPEGDGLSMYNQSRRALKSKENQKRLKAMETYVETKLLKNISMETFKMNIAELYELVTD